MPKIKQVQLCPCGSNKKYKQCCGIPSQAKSDRKRTDRQVPILFEDAVVAHRENRFIHSLTAVKEILTREPYHLGAIRLLSSSQDQMKIFSQDELEVIAVNTMEGYPDDLELICGAGDIYEALGKHDKSLALYRQVLEKIPHHFRAHFGIGRWANNRQQLELAEYHLRLACYARQFAPIVLSILGGVLSALGRKEEAEHYFRIAYAQLPGNILCLVNWSRMEESRGNIERAWSLLNFAADPEHSGAGLKIHKALLHRRAKNFKKALLMLDQVTPEELDLAGIASYWFERSATLDKMALYDQAFECAQRANSIKAEQMGLKYDSGKAESKIKAIKSAFTKKNIARIKSARRGMANDVRPVFICGFTRSGTSLVEQILSAHSKICGGDELPFIYDLAGNATALLQSENEFPKCLWDKKPGQEISNCEILRQQYLYRLSLTSTLEPGVKRFTDKMPMNEMHIGLMQLVLPESQIIHVFRHPLDSVLSSYFIDASHGGYCGYDIKAAASHYRKLFEITEYYISRMDVSYLRVRYEDIVNNAGKEIRKMLKFLGEPFEQNCVDFHTNPRYARTASYAQVTEKIYKSSVFRYKNYSRHLEDIVPILNPVIKKLGYHV